ncbi:hypothetical protein BABA_03704 [Neobacillus bataviensis LMG 21833]|uniref:Uncharacterized protein n=1 Tax=Neobacillus bataviensis LMG 21833 TaxID=1117379 RepID=K6EBX8_9BACI|nr:hypothetical protein BABA_03704 [Neobacillus bataviensis LMG 21833]
MIMKAVPDPHFANNLTLLGVRHRNIINMITKSLNPRTAKSLKVFWLKSKYQKVLNLIRGYWSNGHYAITNA